MKRFCSCYKLIVLHQQTCDLRLPEANGRGQKGELVKDVNSRVARSMGCSSRQLKHTGSSKTSPVLYTPSQAPPLAGAVDTCALYGG